MRTLFTLLLSFLTVSLIAQTKKIAFKSHSGNMANFQTALEHDLFDTDNSNFGQAPIREIVSAQLDSVIFVCDSVAILVTSQYCITENRYSKETISGSTLWKAGRETAFKHPLFSQKHSLDSIKKILEEQYYFRNKINKVVFIGYDNKKPDEKKKEEKKKKEIFLITSTSPEKIPGTFDGGLAFLFSAVVTLSLVAAKYSQRNNS